MKILFACDLDNTLLHSYSHKKEGDICIEYKNGEEQGYVTKYVHDNFSSAINGVDFVPATSRSILQTKRISFFDKFAIYIIASNGGRLLVNGKEDNEWSKTTDTVFKTYKDEFDKLTKKASEESELFKYARIVDNTYFYLSVNDGFDVKSIFDNYQKNTTLVGLTNKKKIYFTPEQINKGHAVLKLKEKLGSDLVVAAGDSVLDLSMLNIADIAIVPNEDFASNIKAKTVYVNEHELNFCDFVVITLERILEDYNL